MEEPLNDGTNFNVLNDDFNNSKPNNFVDEEGVVQSALQLLLKLMSMENIPLETVDVFADVIDFLKEVINS